MMEPRYQGVTAAEIPVVTDDDGSEIRSQVDNRSLVRFGPGDEMAVQAGDDGVRFLLVSGIPLRESVAWYGPIVMNTQEELRRAFEELRAGTFLG